MNTIAKFVSSIRQLLSRKLGRCPLCMRASLLGSALGWACFAIVWNRWDNPIALAVTAFVAGCFTALLLAHLVAYEVRVARSMRTFESAVRLSPQHSEFRIGRREFISNVLRAGAAFALIAMFGRSFGIAGQAGACAPTSLAQPVCGGGANDVAATAAMFLAADAACNGLCESLMCAVDSSCLRSGLAAVAANGQINCQDDGHGGRICCAPITCPCACYKCENTAPPAGTEAIGMADNKGDAWSAMKADADAKCLAFCKKIDKCPPAKPNCKMNGTPKVKATQRENCFRDIETGKWVCRGSITNCPCACRQ